jgi:hypothetical protein
MNITELIKKHLNKVVKEQESHISEDGTYMVLSNLVQIKNDIEKILSLINKLQVRRRIIFHLEIILKSLFIHGHN